MRAGFAKIGITPPVGTRMMGFGSRDREHGCVGVHDDIFVRALHLQHGGEACLIMGFDMCFVGRDECDRFKAAIGERTGLIPASILMNASHSHVGPASGRWYYGGYLPPEDEYLSQLQNAVVRAAVEAGEAASEVTVSAGVARSNLPMNRRLKQPDGSTIMASNPDGFTFDAVPICLLKDADDRPVCLLFSVACHPSMMSGFEISAEYPGVAMDRLDAHLGVDASLFLQGVGGDTKPCVIGDGERWRTGTWEEMERAGEMVAGEVIEGLEAGLEAVEPDLRACATEVDWPMSAPMSKAEYEAIAGDSEAPEVKRWWAERIVAALDRGEQLPNAATLILQGIRIGASLRIIALEGEAVSGYGPLISEFFGGGVTFPLGYSNGEGLYLPTTEMIPEGGYEVVSFWEYGFPAPLAPGFEGILTEAMARLEI